MSSSFTIPELAALAAPIAALVLVPWGSPERRRRLAMVSALWLAVFTAGGAVGLRLSPEPLGAGALALAVLAGWVIVFALRPDRERRVARRLYRVAVGAALLANYLIATLRGFGIGFTAEQAMLN